jgi:hypothetical protein
VSSEIRQAVRRAGARAPHPAVMVMLAVLGAVVGQFAIELGAGRVPIPATWSWAVPILNAGLVVLVAHLPSPVSRGRALSQ